MHGHALIDQELHLRIPGQRTETAAWRQASPRTWNSAPSRGRRRRTRLPRRAFPPSARKMITMQYHLAKMIIVNSRSPRAAEQGCRPSAKTSIKPAYNAQRTPGRYLIAKTFFLAEI